MRRDRLNIDQFVNQDGGNYRQAADLDRDLFVRLADQVNAELLDFSQEWRHGVGRMKKNGQTLFFKIASTPEIGQRTRNEVSWNTSLTSALTKDASFLVPRIIETGEIENKFFYLSEYFPGVRLMEKGPNTRPLYPWIEKIVSANVFLLGWAKRFFDRDETEPDSSLFQRYKKRTIEWKLAVSEENLDEVLNVALTLDQHYHPGNTHGDFVPWHMIQSGEKFVLIDGEHATGRQARYYDIAYFFHRLWTTGRDSALAKQYLRLVVHEIGNREAFISEFRPILASRIIGGFWDLKSDGATEEEKQSHQSLRESFLQDTFAE